MLGLINDIIKGIPENAVLRGKLAELRTQIEALEAKNKENEAKIAEHEKKLNADIKLDPIEVSILTTLSNFDGATIRNLLGKVAIHPVKMQYHLDRLCEGKYAYGQQFSTDRETEWHLGNRGRAYLVETGLI
jgi:DNA-binding MarR family transcriptional regulator